MFPNHQRRERSREPHQSEQQQHQSQYPAQYPPNSQAFTPSPQQYPPQGYTQTQQGYSENQPSSDPHLLQPDAQQLAFDSSSHSHHSNNNSQTYPPQQQHQYPPPQQQQQYPSQQVHQYPHQHQQQYPPQQQLQQQHEQLAPYPKWTPPNNPMSTLHQPPQQQEPYPPSETQHPLDQSPPPQGITDPTPNASAVAGHKDYEWKPPAALQAFQSTDNLAPSSSPSTTELPPQVEVTEPVTIVHHDPTVIPDQTQGQAQGQGEVHPDQVEVEDDSSGFTNFLSWAKLEDPADVSEFLFNDPNIAIVTDAHGNCFLHGACDVGNISMVQFFLKHFPVDSFSSLQLSNDQGFEPIHMAAFGGMLHIVGLLLKFDPSLATRRTRSGSTMLHLAVANSNFQLVDFLLETLDDETIWAVNDGGSNVLHLACKFGNAAMIDRFAKLPGANVNFCNIVEDSTCADLICHHFDETMHVLVSNGAQLEAKCATDLLGPKMKSVFPVAKTSFRVAAPRSSSDGSDHTSSPYSSKNLRKSQGGVSLVEESRNNDVDSEDSHLISSPTTRRKSSSYFPPSNASFLPPKEDSSSKIKAKETVPKNKSSKSKSKKISNSNSWIKSSSSDDDGVIVKVSTAFKKDMPLSGQTEEEGDKDEEDNEEQQEEGEEEGNATVEVTDTDIDTEDSEDVQLFKFASESKIPELEAVLGVFPSILKDVNTIRNSVDNTSLLHSAATSGSLDVAQYLVEGVGADVNALDSNKQSPLHYAVEATQLILVRYLVKYCGALLDTKDINGKTALDLLSSASGEDRDEIERILTKAAKKSPDKRLKVTIPKFPPA